jgi:tetratricopeptide (TPR) repeat protein
MGFHRSSAGLMLAIGLLGAVVPEVAAQERAVVPVRLESSTSQKAAIEQLLATGKQQYRQADFRAAIATYQQVLSSGAEDAKVEALLQLAEIDLWIGKTTLAETKIKQAIELARKVSSRQLEGRSLHMLAAVERYRENYAKATELLNLALPILQAVGDREGEARIYLQFGFIDHAQAKFPQALEKFQTALKTAQAGNHQDVIVTCYNWLAKTQRSLKNIPQAETLIQKQQELSRLTGYRLGEYSGLTTVRWLQQDQKQIDQAIGTSQKQLAIAQSANNSWFQMDSAMVSANIYLNREQFSQGLSFYRKALSIAKKIDNKAVGLVQSRIGYTYLHKRRFSRSGMNKQAIFAASHAYEKALESYQKTNDKRLVAESYDNLAETYSMLALLHKDEDRVKFISKLEFAYQNAAKIYGKLGRQNKRIISLVVQKSMVLRN